MDSHVGKIYQSHGWAMGLNLGHFAGPVTYQCINFLDKNKDQLDVRSQELDLQLKKYPVEKPRGFFFGLSGFLEVP